MWSAQSIHAQDFPLIYFDYRSNCCFIQASIHAQDVPLIYFDYHSECRGGKVDRIEKIKPKLDDVIKQHNFFLKVNAYNMLQYSLYSSSLYI